MAERRAVDSEFVFQGGPVTDVHIIERTMEDSENMVAPEGGGAGLGPRKGIDHILQVAPASVTEGCVVFTSDLTDVGRTKLVVCMNASTGNVIHLSSYTDQEGRTEPLPFSGGFDPDDPNADGEGLPVTPVEEPAGVVAQSLITLTNSLGELHPGNYFLISAAMTDAEWPHFTLSESATAPANVFVEFQTFSDANAFVSDYVVISNYVLQPGVPVPLRVDAPTVSSYNVLYQTRFFVLEHDTPLDANSSYADIPYLRLSA